MALPNRKSLRLKDFDYSKGWFFVTTCTYHQRCILGCGKGREISLTEAGRVVAEEWVKTGEIRPGVILDDFVVMPNHFHGIVSIGGEVSLGTVMAQFKSVTSKRISAVLGALGTVWQRGFYEHVVRNEKDLYRIRRYISQNPLKWNLDRENPDATGCNEDEALWFL